MTGPDDEFDDFLARRKPVFRRAPDEVIGPPESIDRVVLRQAREAIEGDRPSPLYRGPGWGVPLAVAATVLLALGVVLQVGLPGRGQAPAGTRNVAQQLEAATAPNNPAAPAPAIVADARPAAPAPAPAGDSVAQQETQRQVLPAPPPPPVAAATPAWRSDARSWLAEIERLRASGRNAEAEAELAEYKRQHRAYAGAPDR